jgi:bifunctional non-homologous end joining protein LigD
VTHGLSWSRPARGHEGLIAKRIDAPYVSTRSNDWLKLKCKRRQEFVVCGFTDRADDPRQVGSLLLGAYDDGALIPVGSVGTGWTGREAREPRRKLGGCAAERRRGAAT